MSKRVALGGAIRAIRVAKSLTPAHQIDKRTSHDPATYVHGKFAVACLISASTLTNIEAGRRQPSPQVLERIAQLLRVDLDAISYACADCASKEIAA